MAYKLKIVDGANPSGSLFEGETELPVPHAGDRVEVHGGAQRPVATVTWVFSDVDAYLKLTL